MRFDGKELTIGQLSPYLMSPDRTVRMRAHQAKFDAFGGVEDTLNTIFDRLVKVRTAIAHKLGFHSFIELGYARLKRSDYDATLVSKFRHQIASELVPFVSELFNAQSSRLGVHQLKYYDEKIFFNTGDPITKHKSAKEIVNAVQKMYAEWSPETNEYFTFMVNNNLLDLEIRENKSGGGFIHYIREYQSPFIFANIHGVSNDIRLLIHESGHGFQFYQNRKSEVPEYMAGTFEVTEIPSMSFEILSASWNHYFFDKEDAKKYGFMQVMGGFQHLPYITAIDEFQHIIYTYPNLTPTERNDVWKELEKKYMPTRDYDGHSYLEKGSFWHQQSHIFLSPFYYVDYAFATGCAIQFWKREKENHEKAWNNFLHLCKLGGSVSFLTLLEEVNLPSPFDKTYISNLIKEIKSWLAEMRF